MEFKVLVEKIKNNFLEISKNGELFRSNVNGNDLWDKYISSFKPENNPVFRDPNSSVNNCNLDKSFIRRYGNIVSVDENNNITTMFDIDIDDTSEYYDSIIAIRNILKNSEIKDVFFETYVELNNLPYEKINKNQEFFQLGIEKNHKIYTQEESDKFGVVTPGIIYEFNHFYTLLNKKFVDFSNDSIETIMGKFRDNKNVFKRAMDELSLDTLILVRDLINQNSLLDGTTHLEKLESIIVLKKEYDVLSDDVKDNWCWVKSYKYPFAKFKNELIGVLCSELSEGEELNKACLNWNKRVDPKNYMKATAPITTKQIAEAKKFVEDNGYEESFNRRLATINDIKISEILHSNVGSDKPTSVSIFDNVKPTVKSKHNRNEFKGIEEVSIDRFMNDILPNVTSIEALLLNTHDGNMVTLTTSSNSESKKMFKWDNNYSWTFNGNLAGKSQIKESVKLAGGNVDGILRASLIWNESGLDNSDLDLWCKQPNHEEIGYSTRFRKDRDNGRWFSSCGGQLDLDNTGPTPNIGIENIYFTSKTSLKGGEYVFKVNQYSDRGSKGFKFEIEFNGEIYQYEYNKCVNGTITVAKVLYNKEEDVFTIQHLIEPINSLGIDKEIYGLQTNQFHKVNLVCLSPNHWGDNNIGNKHYFFMLDNCKPNTPIRSFHNENLNSDLIKHRKVMEVLGTTTMIDVSEEKTKKSLSGLGFNSTVKDELILKLTGSFKRTIKVKF